MAEQKSPLTKEEKKAIAEGRLNKKTPVIVHPHLRVPSNEAYKHMTKQQFVNAMKLLKEKRLDMEKFSMEWNEKKAKQIAELDKEKPILNKEDIAVQISELKKLHPATEKSIRAKIDLLPDEVDIKSLNALLDDKKVELKSDGK